MKAPLFVKPLTGEEHKALAAGLRSSDAFTMRRCQILLASSKSPWLNNIEPKWIHGKRAVTEADSVLSAQQLASHICDYFGSDHHEHLKQNVS